MSGSRRAIEAPDEDGVGGDAMGYTEPVWERSALVTVDMQRDFVLDGAPAQVPGTLEVVPAVASLAESYRAARLPIIHVVRAYSADGSDVDLCPRLRQVARLPAVSSTVDPVSDRW